MFIGRGYEDTSLDLRTQEGREHKVGVVRLCRAWSALQRSMDLSYRQWVAWV